MTGGFSFCGVDIAEIGLEYAPELEDTYVYRAAKPKIHEETYDGHNGGYYYGMSREPKEFTLRCIFEEKEIDRGLMAKVQHLFREGKSGRLIFSRRPWCYYYVTVTELDTTGITNYLNGIIKIMMKAYYPFGRSELVAVNRQHEDYYRVMENTAFLESEEMIPPVTFCQTPATEPFEFLLFNPGDEYAPVGIEIAGDVGKGVTITNETTNESCKFVAMSAAEFDGTNSYLYLDGMNGKCVKVNDGVSTMAFLYHDQGFISLEPAFPIRRNVRVTVDDGLVTTVNKLYDRNSGETREEAEAIFKGQYIWLQDKWRLITGIGKEYDPSDYKAYRAGQALNERHIILDDTPEERMSETTVICSMNKIKVEPVSTMNLTRLKFIYYPTFS